MKMTFYIIVEDGYIDSVGATTARGFSAGVIVSAAEAETIAEALANQPGDEYRLRADTLRWEVPE